MLILSSRSDPVGVAHSVLSVAIMLSRNSVKVVVGCPRQGWLTDELNRHGIPFVILGHRPTIRGGLKGALRLFVLLIRDKELRVIYLNGRLSAFISVIAMALLRRRFVITIRQSMQLGSSGLWSWRHLLHRTILSFGVQKISTVSKAMYDDLQQRYGDRVAAKCRVLPNFIVDMGSAENESASREEGGGSPAGLESPWKILYVGRLVREKGLDVLLCALRILKDRRRQFRCTVLGEGPLMNGFREQARSLGIIDEVVFAGAVPNAVSHFAAYDILAVPSRHESFGRVVLEAWSSRLPVAATQVEGLAELIDDGVNGLLVPTEQPFKLADAIDRISQDSELRQRIVAGGLRRVRRYCANEDLVRQYMSFFFGRNP